MDRREMTVFTPTYNRAYILPKLYNSLCEQTCKNFEWLIVDDGSTDNTSEIIEKWIAERKIEIRYFKQKNGGKQRAHNLGVEKSNGKVFVCVDSDDYVLRDFVEKHLECIEKVKDNKKIGGVISLQGHEDGTPMGTFFPKGLKQTTISELYGKLGFKGDATLLHYTDIIKKFPFEVEEGEKFIGEGFVYSHIDQYYDLAVLPKILMIKEYLPDGYTKNVRKLTKDNPKGYTKLKKQTIKFSKSWKERYIQTILYMVGCRMSKQKGVKNAPYKILAVLAYFPAWLAWVIFYKNA
ncbi:glycosyltransferase family A protein [Dorea longicatena]|uniref:glycosyltransferase family A protein n=1 Tax=Dorea longicatena TaxID=88431 RepID=UPI001899C8FA|nr:glycosyltransferase family 2 protein [Dorea longicatena]UOX54827.1 glycosyltransferase family 2 protein [Dorea longicatena]